MEDTFWHNCRKGGRTQYVAPIYWPKIKEFKDDSPDSDGNCPESNGLS